MSDERTDRTYTGSATLVGADARDVSGVRVHVDLAIEVEREAIDSVLPGLRSWRGTASLVDPVDAARLSGICTLLLPLRGSGEVYVTATMSDEGAVTLELQGVGVAPWLSGADADS